MSTSNVEDELHDKIKICLATEWQRGYWFCDRENQGTLDIKYEEGFDGVNLQEIMSLINAETTKAIERFVEGLLEKKFAIEFGDVVVHVDDINQALEGVKNER